MKYIVDRIEENYAICEDENKKMIEIELKKLPTTIKEGDVILKKDSHYIILENETKKLSEEIFELTEGMWE